MNKSDPILKLSGCIYRDRNPDGTLDDRCGQPVPSDHPHGWLCVKHETKIHPRPIYKEVELEDGSTIFVRVVEV